MKNVLVTGGAGYVGSVLVEKLLRAGYNVKVLDLFIYGEELRERARNIANLDCLKGDIRDQELLKRVIPGSDALIHLACISNDPSFELNPELGKSINFDAFHPLVKISKESGVKRFIYASSASVYGIKEEENVTEELPLEPLTDYSKYKALCEEILLSEQEPGFTTLIIRPATVCGYSPRMRLDLTVNILTNHGINRGKITVFGGEQKRPNLHIQDMTNLYVRCLQYPDEKIAGKVYNAGYENHKVMDIAKMVQKVIGEDRVGIVRTHTDDNRSYHISSQKIKRELGFEPEFTIEDAIRDLKEAFEAGKIPDPFDDIRYYNIKTMQAINLTQIEVVPFELWEVDLMKVKYSYLEEQFEDPKDILNNIDMLVKTADFTLGKPVEEFEQRFARLLDARYAVGVNSGTDSLFLSLKAIGVEPGDEVITSPNTFIATVGAIVAAGARPVFVDVTEEYVIDSTKIEAAITPKTTAIMPVHYAGHPADIEEIMEIAERHSLPVVEDACQAISAEVNGKCCGTFGVTGGFSLHPLKNLNVWGDGGVIVTNSLEIRDRLRLLRNHGLVNRDEVAIFGYNSRLDSIQAVVGNHLINDIEQITRQRIEHAELLDKELGKLAESVKIPTRKQNKKYVYHLYMIIVKERDQLLKHLLDNGIEAKIHYPIPLHLQDASKSLGYKMGDFPVCESQCKSMITLPVHQHLTEEQISYMIDKIKEFYL